MKSNFRTSFSSRFELLSFHTAKTQNGRGAPTYANVPPGEQLRLELLRSLGSLGADSLAAWQRDEDHVIERGACSR
jgi:hypothetical protein